MDDATFIRLCEEEMAVFYRVAVSILRRQQDAEDAVQQAFMKGWAVRDRAWRGSEKAWVMRIVINECRNIQRYRMRVTPVASVPEAASDSPDITLRIAMDALPENLRLPLLLKYMEGMSEKDIAAALRLSLPTVKGRLLRARKTLQREWHEEVEWP